MLFLHIWFIVAYIVIDGKKINKKDYCTRKCLKGNPICGSDNKDYSNHCELKKFNCLNNKNITVLSHGKCVDYCTRKCLKGNPVCGSDNKDYSNHCELKKFNCLNEKSITVLHYGKCDSCPSSCTKNYKPICAANNATEKTFLNFCQFKRENCQTKIIKDMFIYKKKGPCKPWQKRSCPIGCSDIWAPVCANNGKTYSSICAVKLAGCGEKPLGLQKVGYCSNRRGSTGNRDCPDSCPENYKPTCGSDGILYVNECEMRLHACRDGKMKELKRKPNRNCNKKCISSCPHHDNKVCGSNSITYKNECELRRKSCIHKKKWFISKRGPCDEGTIEYDGIFLDNGIGINSRSSVPVPV